MAFLYGEQTSQSKAALNAHLGSCATCRGAVAKWQGAIQHLGKWKLPRSSGARSLIKAQPVVKWALAAALVLGLGYTIGRLSTPAVDLTAIRTALEGQLRDSLVAQVKQEVQEQFTADWKAVLSGKTEEANTPFRQDLLAGLNQVTAKAVSDASAEHQRVMMDWLDTYNADRQQDKRATLALIDQTERKRVADNFKLRRSLETVALVADHKFQRTETELDQLASYAQASVNPEDIEESMNPATSKRN